MCRKKVAFANSVDSNEAAQNELPHLGLHSLSSGLRIFNIIQSDKRFFELLQI